LVGVAVKVTGANAQTGFVDVDINTLTGKIGFTVIVTVLDVAGLFNVQGSIDVITTDITSPLAGT